MKTITNQGQQSSITGSKSDRQGHITTILDSYKERSTQNAFATGSHQKTLQRIAVGYAPTNPGNYRNFTQLNGLEGSPASDKPFHNGQRANILTNNVNKGGGNAPLIGPGQHPIDDTSGGRLLDRTMATNYDPEIDHIVPRSEGGANDYNNARVISKANNLGGGVARPNNTQRVLRLYENITLSANAPNSVYNPTPLAAGHNLDLTQARLLATYANVQYPNAIADLGQVGANAIKTSGKGVNNNVSVQ